MKTMKKLLHSVVSYAGGVVLLTCAYVPFAHAMDPWGEDLENMIAECKTRATHQEKLSEWRKNLKPEAITPEILREEMTRFADISKEFNGFSVSAMNAQRKISNQPRIKELEKLIPPYFEMLTQERLLGIHTVFSDPSFDWKILENEDPKLLHQFSTFIYNQNMVNYGYWHGISDQDGFWHALCSKKNHYMK